MHAPGCQKKDTGKSNWSTAMRAVDYSSIANAKDLIRLEVVDGCLMRIDPLYERADFTVVAVVRDEGEVTIDIKSKPIGPNGVTFERNISLTRNPYLMITLVEAGPKDAGVLSTPIIQAVLDCVGAGLDDDEIINWFDENTPYRLVEKRKLVHLEKKAKGSDPFQVIGTV